MAKYFGTYGIRGKLDLLTSEFAVKICSSFGTYLNGGKIIIGRDARLTGEMLRNAAVAGLLSVGCEVVDLGVVPAPTVELKVKEAKASGGIAITASHNPPEWNAFKFMGADGIGVSKEEGEKIERIFEENRIKKAEWNEVKKVENYPNALKEHKEIVKKYVNSELIKKEKLRLLLDCGNGTASLIAPQMLKELGCQVITINSQLDGSFPGRNSEPTKDNLRDLINSVKTIGADAGIAWDGDADRVVFVDEKGNYIFGDKSFALSTRIALEERKGPVVTTIATSNAIADTAQKYGGKIEYVKVGGPYISKRVRELHAVIGGEEAGGVVWPKIHYGKDGIITAAKIVEEICKQGAPLSSLVKEMPEYYNAKTKVNCPSKKKMEVLNKFKERIKGEGKIIEIDGVRINFTDSWVIVRASWTEDYIRIFSEAKKQKEADRIVEKYKEIVKKLSKN